MRLELSADPNSRAGRLLARVPRLSAFTLVELALLALVALQAARLLWALATPVGPVGDWKAPAALTAPVQAGPLGSFDPFFRLAENTPAVVTSLNIQLFGVREDRATGRGSAILQLPDGSQRSFIVGEEIIPGVTLAEVGFDSVTIDRAGTREQVFLDQSQPVPAAPGQPGTVQPTVTPTPTTAAPAAPTARADIPFSFQPRMSENQVTGLTVGPGGDGGQAFRAAGLQPGDVVTAVNGTRVVSAAQVEALLRASDETATFTIERGGRSVQISVRL